MTAALAAGGMYETIPAEPEKDGNGLYMKLTVPKKNIGIPSDGQKVAVVTGGANGIGKCIAEEFRKQGVKFYAIDKAPGDHYVEDISDKAVRESFAEMVIRETSGIDYLIDIALPLMKGIAECSYGEFRHALSVGATAPSYLLKLFAPYFRTALSKEIFITRRIVPMGMLRYMEPFFTDHIPSVLLTGNGLHRAFENSNWDKLLKDLSKGRFTEKEWEILMKLPYPQLAIAATGNHLNTGMKEASQKYIVTDVLPGEDSLIKKAIDTGFEAILTTNYSYELEKTLCPEFFVTIGRASKYRRKTCKDKPTAETRALYHYLQVPYGNSEKSLWHIHGEAAIPESMIIGHYYYGRLLSRIQTYTAETIKRYKVAEQKNSLFYPRSWVDYILFGNVYIIGQGMDFSEMDLWWLTDCKRLYGKGRMVLYKPGMRQEQIMLAEACGVTVRTCDEPLSYADYL